MDETTTREEQRSRLDQFASVSAQPTGQDVATVSVAAPPAEIYGSREVATKRDMPSVMSELKVLAAAAGEDWYYRFPVRNKRKGTIDYIEGPSIDLALDLARTYGNCHIDCRAQDYGNVILFHARFHDVEKGFSITRPFQQRKGAAKLGGDDKGRLDEIDFSIGASKAIRNATTNALRTLANFCVQEAKAALVDKIGNDIERFRRLASERIERLVSLDRVERVIGRPAKDWLAADIAKVIAMGTAINEGMASADDTFPKLQAEADERAMVGKSLDQFASGVVEEETGQAAAHGEPSGAPAAPSTSTPPNPEGAAAPDVHALQEDVIMRLLRLAQDGSISVQERLENLEGLIIGLKDRMPGHDDFVDTAVNTAAKVAKGELLPLAAQKYLSGLVKP